MLVILNNVLSFSVKNTFAKVQIILLKRVSPPLNNVKIMNFVCGGDSRGAIVSY